MTGRRMVRDRPNLRESADLFTSLVRRGSAEHATCAKIAAKAGPVTTKIAVEYWNPAFAAISGVCVPNGAGFAFV